MLFMCSPCTVPGCVLMYAYCIDRFCISWLSVIFQFPVALYQCLLGCSRWPSIVVYFPWYTYYHHLISSMMLISVIVMGNDIFYGWGGVGGLSHSPPTPLLSKKKWDRGNMYIKENIPQWNFILNNPIGTGRVQRGTEREQITVKYKI